MEIILKILKFLQHYINAIILMLCAFSFLIVPPDEAAREALSSSSSILVVVWVSIIHAILTIWAFTIGPVYMIAQFIYGLIRYFKEEIRRIGYLHHCNSAVISMMAYVIIFTSSAT
ncbi:MAG: hypothetical protein ACI9SC_002019 [Gammaproteobacteria bacterium]|jgi:hypothetical protein